MIFPTTINPEMRRSLTLLSSWSLLFLRLDIQFVYLIQLMKSDGQVFKSEIHFCETIAEKLGYKKGVVAELSSRIYSDPTITADRNMLMERAHKFIK